MTSSFITAMTSAAFEEAARADAVVVIPLGSTELEGTHLPLGADTIVADGIAQRLSSEPSVLIGPTLPIGYSKWFLPFAGTISLETETLIRVLTEYVESLMSAGIKRFVFLNAHKGNNASIEATARRLIAGQAVRIGMLSLWKLAHDLCAVKDQAVAEGRFTHAGEIMTSTVMALAPKTVVEDRVRADTVKSPPNSAFKVINSLGETEFLDSVQIIFQDIRDVTDSGTLGDPSAASVEKGAAMVDRITEYARAFLREFRKLPLK